MKPIAIDPPPERKTKIIHFRVPDSVQASLCARMDPSTGLKSGKGVAMALTLRGLAEQERDQQIADFNVYNVGHYALFQGDAASILARLPAKAFRTCITSPPYWRQRNYGNDPEQIGQESTPEQYIKTSAGPMACTASRERTMAR